MTTLQDFLISILLAILRAILVAILYDDDPYRVAGFARHLLDARIQENVDAFISEQAAKSVAYVRVFFGHQPPVAIDHRHFAAEAAHGLRKLNSYVAAADDEQMFGNFIEFKRLDVREWLRFRKTRSCIQRGTRARTDNHVRAPQLTCGAIGHGDFHSSRSNESPRAQYEFGACVPVILHIHFVQVDDHFALAVSDARHVNRETIACDTEFLGSASVVHNFRAVDDVLAGKARDVRA